MNNGQGASVFSVFFIGLAISKNSKSGSLYEEMKVAFRKLEGFLEPF